jgi:hypothetical protein
MRFVGKVALDRFFSEYFGFTLSVSFHQCSILIFIYTFLLPEGQMDEAWEPSKSNALSEVVDRKVLPICVQRVKYISEDKN